MSGDVSVARVMPADLQVTWAVVTDIDNWPQYLRGTVGLRRLSGDGYVPGNRWVETVKLFGKEIHSEVFLKQLELGKYSVHMLEASEGRIEIAYRFTPRPDGTEVEVTYRIIRDRQSALKRIFGDLAGAISDKVIKSQLAADLEDYEAAIRRILAQPGR